MLLPMLLFACRGAAIQVGGDDTTAGVDTAPGGDSVEHLPGDESGAGPDTGDDTGGGHGDHSACADLYDPDLVPSFEVEISDAEWASLVGDYASGQKNYHPIVFRYDDEEVDDAQIRLKGNPGFSWFDEKMQFVISFNEVDPDARFHGLRKIALDASWYEPTMLRDRISWEVMRTQGGLPTACSNSALLTVNGAYYGVYTNIEYFDHEWLERNFGDDDATGTLWKYGSDPVSNADASDGSAINAMWRTTDVDTLSTLGDLEEWELEWAAEAVLGDDDGYWCCDHNYYLYEHPTRGILFVPWDFDDNFDVQPYDADPVDGYYAGLFQQAQFRALTRDADWGPRYVDQVAAMNAAMDPDTVIADMDAWEAPIADAIASDPHRSIGWEEHEEGVTRMKAWVRARHAYVDSWVACERGDTTDDDADGYSVCDDPDDTDPTVHPGATESCNGVDDDADGWIDDDASCDDCARHDFGDRHFLFCRWPRTYTAAAANCATRGGELTNYTDTGEYYMFFFYTWPIREAWWTSGSTSSRCPAWDEANWSSTYVACTEEHPSVCEVP